jgi:phage terminase large subunit-like protein
MSSKIVRFISKVLPSKIENQDTVRNTQYPELMKRLPKELIVKDITARNPVLTIRDPFSSQYIFVEFTSFLQSVGSMAGVERAYVWIDECPPYSVYEENNMRLISTGGDMIITLTPAESEAEWIYSMLYERARHIYRSKVVAERLKQVNKSSEAFEEQHLPNNPDITVIYTATDDNPYLRGIYEKELEKYRQLKEVSPYSTFEEFISSRFFMLTEESDVNVRRYGLFSNVSGRVYKDFNPLVHVINPIDHFASTSVPQSWKHFRTIDYHESNDWACLWGALSPENECFIYDELKISPHSHTLEQIAFLIARKSKQYRYAADLIDPRAQIKSINTSTSPVQELNNIFYKLRRDSVCSGAYWRSFDTVSDTGREEIRKRLKGSLQCGRPFNNNAGAIPTIWILSPCRYTIESMRNWSYETWKNRDKLLEKDMKEKPQQKYSHFCTALEGALKEKALVSRLRMVNAIDIAPTYFNNRMCIVR